MKINSNRTFTNGLWTHEPSPPLSSRWKNMRMTATVTEAHQTQKKHLNDSFIMKINLWADELENVCRCVMCCWITIVLHCCYVHNIIAMRFNNFYFGVEKIKYIFIYMHVSCCSFTLTKYCCYVKHALAIFMLMCVQWSHNGNLIALILWLN